MSPANYPFRILEVITMGSLRSLRRAMPESVPPPKPSDEELIMAVYTGTSREVKALLANGADPTATDGNLESALGIAALHGELGMTRLLVGYGADLDQRNVCGFTAFHLAATSLHSLAPKICNFLLDHGADVNASNSGGWTPLMMAVMEKEFHIARLLIEKGADATLTNGDGSRALDLLRPGKGAKALRRLLQEIS